MNNESFSGTPFEHWAHDMLSKRPARARWLYLRNAHFKDGTDAEARQALIAWCARHGIKAGFANAPDEHGEFVEVLFRHPHP